MAHAEIMAGNCGYKILVEAKMEQTETGQVCNLTIESDCKAIKKLAAELKQVNPYKEISFRRNMPTIIQAGIQYCTHAACPGPVGIVKAVEIEAQLALPTDVIIKLSKE